MKLNTKDRMELFHVGRALDRTIGNLFQDEMEISNAQIQEEIDAAYAHMKAQKERFNKYIWKLGDMLCFPENFK